MHGAGAPVTPHWRCRWFGHDLPPMPRPEIGLLITCPRCGACWMGVDARDQIRVTNDEGSALSIEVMEACMWREVQPK